MKKTPARKPRAARADYPPLKLAKATPKKKVPQNGAVKELLKLADLMAKAAGPLYDLFAGKPVLLPPTYASMQTLMMKAMRGDFRLWRTVKGHRFVSTVFLWTDHGFGNGLPVLFESYYHDGKSGEVIDRYCTKGEAWAGHQALCRKYRVGVPDLEQRHKPFKVTIP